MIDGQRVLAVIAARGGSKGLPRKNVLPLGGQPLVAWSVRAAQSSRLIDRCLVSTDDAEIAAAARAAGGDVPFLRPAALADDTAAIEDVVLHALDFAEAEAGQAYDLVVLLQATSPLRIAEDIDQTLACCLQHDAPTAIAVVPSAKSPYWSFGLDGAQRLTRLFAPPSSGERRQALPQTYLPSGAVYVARVAWFRDHRRFVAEATVGHIIPPERAVDIDTRLDFTLCEALLRQQSESASNA
jgi:CMP-N,N'-diacetyllegionaminic acid synthase